MCCAKAGAPSGSGEWPAGEGGGRQEGDGEQHLGEQQGGGGEQQAGHPSALYEGSTSLKEKSELSSSSSPSLALI